MASAKAKPEPRAGKRYTELENNRRPFLDRAREGAALTIPYLMPPQGFTSSSQLPTPYQSHGARGVRTLSSKLLLALFPNAPFFRYSINEGALAALNTAAAAVSQAQGAEAQKTKRGEVEVAMAARERAIMQELGIGVFRPIAFTALQHLLVSGNFCLYAPPEGGRVKGFRLDQFVVLRDPSGTILEGIIHESIAESVLPEKVRALLGKQTEMQGSETKNLDLYTHIERVTEGKTAKWRIYQEINEIILPDSIGAYDIEQSPWLFLRLSAQPGEDYGRGYIEEYLGDLDSLEGLTEAIVEGSVASSRVIFLVNPNGVTSLRVVQSAENLAVVSGKAEDVTTMQVQKQGDLQVAMQHAQALAQSLSYAFLMNAAVQRDGERVTAQEIRFLASELDAALGGMYTLLAAEFQSPVVRLFERRMEKRTGAEPLPEDLVQPQIVTGLEAIGRGQDQRNMQAFVQDILQGLGPEVAAPYIMIGEFIKRSAASYSIDTDGLIRSDEDVQAMQQQAQMQQMMETMGPQGISAAGGVLQEAMKQQGTKNVQATQPAG